MIKVRMIKSVRLHLILDGNAYCNKRIKNLEFSKNIDLVPNCEYAYLDLFALYIILSFVLFSCAVRIKHAYELRNNRTYFTLNISQFSGRWRYILLIFPTQRINQ